MGQRQYFKMRLVKVRSKVELLKWWRIFEYINLLHLLQINYFSLTI